ncbi:MAG: hypothetical protein JNK15_12925 [Planctomycetes bacterium]|nr:hypothetical protein [Planctomycetota bacterium]
MATRTQGRTWLRPALVAGVAALGSACVTTYEDTPMFGRTEPPPAFASTVLSIPFGDNAPNPADDAVARFHRSVLQRMHEAAKDFDAAGLEELVAGHDQPGLPPAVAQQVASYRGVARGLRFRQHLKANAKLVQVPPPTGEAPQTVGGAPALGASLHYELQVPAPADPVVLGAKDGDDPIGFVVAVAIDDTFVEGGSRNLKKQDFLWLPTTFELGGNEVLRLPIALDLPAEHAVKREVLVRVDLMPGYVHVAGNRVPVPRTTVAAATTMQWPVGYEVVAKAPLAELQRALQAFEPRAFARAFLAACATTGAEREQALALLMDQVRFGRADQAQVAMAALKAISDAPAAVGDRDGWLAWWQRRR